MPIREYEPLHRHTTLRTGGPARYFAEATSEAEIGEALELARAQRLPVFVLGGGSNLLAGDAGFPGVVIKIATRGIETVEIGGDTMEVAASAGETWDDLVAHTVARGWPGLENMSLIPGTVGGAVVGNIGAYGAEVKDSLRWAEALDTRTGAVRRFDREACDFGYRRSFFKTPEGRKFIVLRAAFGLRPAGALNLSYQDLREHFARLGINTPTLPQTRAAVIAIRQRKLPDIAQVGTAGSFFKNPVIPEAQYAALKARYPGLPGHEDGQGRRKVPLGWILDKVCSLKGVRHGKVGTHDQQALVIVNHGGTAAEIEAVAEGMAEAVRSATGIEIEWEVERLGAGSKTL
jgi:UDP-N-acetylmuramate dehydrogenase